MKKIVISGYYGFNNFGDEAILSVLINKLKLLNLNITIFSVSPQLTSKTYNVNSIQTFDYRNVAKEIKHADILISGGGSLLQDVTSIKSLLYYCWVIFNALLYRKKVIIFAQGIGPINSKFAAFIVKNILKKCDYISVRDENSKKLLDSWNIKSDIVCDPIYSLKLPERLVEPILGVQLRDFHSLNETLLNKLADAMIEKFSDKKIEIFSLQDKLDLPVADKFKQILKSKAPDINIEVLSNLSINDCIRRISNLEYMIAMRFHALLISLMYGIKSAAINYDIKVEKLANCAGIPLISMSAEENILDIFEEMQQLDESSLKSQSSKEFNWDKIIEVINS